MIVACIAVTNQGQLLHIYGAAFTQVNTVYTVPYGYRQANLYAKNGTTVFIRKYFIVTHLSSTQIQSICATPVHYWYYSWEYDITKQVST